MMIYYDQYLSNINTEGDILLDTMLYRATKDITVNVIQESVVDESSSLSSVINAVEINDTEPSTSATILSNHDPPLERTVIVNPNGNSRIEEGVSDKKIEIEDSKNNDKGIVTVDRNHRIIHKAKLEILPENLRRMISS